jgi:predicted ATP-grasp superfamily ATP-dependent carboligase
MMLAESDDNAILSLLHTLAGTESALVADCDRWLRFILRNYVQLNRMFGLVLHPASDVLNTCLHKAGFIKWCQANHFPAPKLYEVNSGSDLHSKVVYPVIIRPDETQHGIADGMPKAVAAHNSNELKHWLTLFEQSNIHAVVSESALSRNVHQYSVGVARKGSHIVSLVTEKIRPAAERCRGGCYVVSRNHENIQQLAEHVLKEMNFQGIAEVEVLWNAESDKYWIIEVNARPWVQFSISEKSGKKLLSFALDGKQWESNDCSGKHRWLWFTADLYECFSTVDGLVTGGKLPFVKYLTSVWAANAYACWSLADPKPFIFEFVRFLFKSARSMLRSLFKKTV